MICGANGTLAGFGLPDPQGNWTGFDVDFCRAIAAAIFNDPTKVKFVPLTAARTASPRCSPAKSTCCRATPPGRCRATPRSGSISPPSIIYDGQGFMVRKALKVSSALELNGASVCVQQGTTTELNLADYFRSNHMELKTRDVRDRGRGGQGLRIRPLRCLHHRFVGPLRRAAAARRSKRQHRAAGDHLQGAAQPGGAPGRRSAGTTSCAGRITPCSTPRSSASPRANVDEQAEIDNPEIRRLLGVEGQFGEALGLTNDWAYRIIKHVGNYGESFERNVGQGSPLKIARGLNALWTKGGLQYGPPIR